MFVWSQKEKIKIRKKNHKQQTFILILSMQFYHYQSKGRQLQSKVHLIYRILVDRLNISEIVIFEMENGHISSKWSEYT